MEDSSYFTSKVYFNVVKEYSAAMSGHIYIYIDQHRTIDWYCYSDIQPKFK